MTLKKKSKTPPVYLDETQALKLIAALDEQDDFQFKVMINTLLFTGMRGGELCGLQWQDIDTDNGVIYIRHTLAYMRGKGKGEKWSLSCKRRKRRRANATLLFLRRSCPCSKNTRNGKQNGRRRRVKHGNIATWFSRQHSAAISANIT